LGVPKDLDELIEKAVQCASMEMRTEMK